MMCIEIAAKKVRPSTSRLITGVLPVTSLLDPLGLSTQVTDQWNFAGVTPEWSDSGEPAVEVTSGTPVINLLVLGLPF